MKLTGWLGLVAVMVLSSCGTDQGSTLSCPSPEHTGCDSLSETYARTTDQPDDLQTEATVRQLRTIEFAEPPRLDPARVVRVWIAPWEDEDGDLHDHQYLYLVVKQPVWNLDRWKQP